MKCRITTLTVVCQMAFHGCVIPGPPERVSADGDPLRESEKGTVLECGTTKEAVIREYGPPSWSAFNDRIFCYEGEFRQGVRFNPIPVVALISRAILASALVAGAAMGGYAGDVSGAEHIVSIIPEDFPENTDAFQRVLIHFDQNAELATFRIFPVEDGDQDHSRLIHLLEFSAEAGVPEAWMTEENIGAALDSVPGRGQPYSTLTSALISAAENGRTEDVEVLLKAGIDPNAASEGGTTALLKASLRGHDETVEMLLKAGADANAAISDGNTSLILASRNGHSKVVEALLEAGADVTAARDDGKTALLLALQNDHEEVVQILLEAGASPVSEIDEE